MNRRLHEVLRAVFTDLADELKERGFQTKASKNHLAAMTLVRPGRRAGLHLRFVDYENDGYLEPHLSVEDQTLTQLLQKMDPSSGGADVPLVGSYLSDWTRRKELHFVIRTSTTSRAIKRELLPVFEEAFSEYRAVVSDDDLFLAELLSDSSGRFAYLKVQRFRAAVALAVSTHKPSAYLAELLVKYERLTEGDSDREWNVGRMRELVKAALQLLGYTPAG